MMRLWLGVAGLGFVLACAHTKNVESSAQEKSQFALTYETFNLKNGLRVVVHTDTKAPVVSVAVWYHVGSKDETAGRWGFAHLFEHLMFYGSEHANGDYLPHLEGVGATDFNGETNNDFTMYYETVPKTALDLALFLESDRMGFLLPAVTQAKMDAQRGVVINEKRQRANEPYSVLFTYLDTYLFPKGHPYSWPTIGSVNDLNAASLEDVKTWFHRGYGPNNAVLVLTGDIDAKTAREKAELYFGALPPGPRFDQPVVEVPTLARSKRMTLTDSVPQTAVVEVWPVADEASDDYLRLELAGLILGGSDTSRLQKRLVHQDKLLDSVSAGLIEGQLASRFLIYGKLLPGSDKSQVEAVIKEETARFLKDGPTKEELAQAKMTIKSTIIKSLESVSGQNQILMRCTLLAKDPGCLEKQMRVVEISTPKDVQMTAQKWLNLPSLTAVVEPGKKTEITEAPTKKAAWPKETPVDAGLHANGVDVDRSQLPKVDQLPEFALPQLQRATLANGLKIVLAERRQVPLVKMAMVFEGAGYSYDPLTERGLASVSMAMLDEGAGSFDALAFAARAESLGASVSGESFLDFSQVSLSVVRETLPEAFGLMCDMILRPRLSQSDFDRVKRQYLADIELAKANPARGGSRMLAGLIFGPSSPYGHPRGGGAVSKDVAALTISNISQFLKSHLGPNNATLVVTGDVSMDEITELAKQQFGDWQPIKPAKPLQPTQGPVLLSLRVFLVDDPGATQANIFAAVRVPQSKNPQSFAFEVANEVLGGSFASRLNMDLREDKHWSYGVSSLISQAKYERLWIALAPVQVDKTAQALIEMNKHISEFSRGLQPASDAELARAKQVLTLTLPGDFETLSALLSSLVSNVAFDRPDDYELLRKRAIEKMDLPQVGKAALWMSPQTMTWLIVGDLSKIKGPIEKLKLGPVQVISRE